MLKDTSLKIYAKQTSVFINSSIQILQPQKWKIRQYLLKDSHLSSCSPFFALYHKAVASGNLGYSNSLLPVFLAGSCKGEVLSVPCWLALYGYIHPSWKRCFSLGIDCCIKTLPCWIWVLSIAELRTVFSWRTLSHYQVLFNSLTLTGIFTQEYYQGIS